MELKIRHDAADESVFAAGETIDQNSTEMRETNTE